MTKPKYAGLTLQTQEGEWISATQVMARVRRRARRNEYASAYTLGMSIVEEAQSAGLIDVAQDLLTDFLKLVPTQRLNFRDRAWLYNALGLVASGTGKHGKAERAFTRMLHLGERLTDQRISSVALQNLGVQRALRGDRRGAREYYERSARLKLQLQDAHGLAQVIANAASLELEADNLRDAKTLLHSIEPLLEELNEPHLSSTVHGTLGTIHAKQGDFEQAQRHLRSALRFAKRSGDLAAEASVLQSMGALLMDSGRPEAAAKRLGEAASLATSIGFARPLELMYAGLATALHSSGRTKEAAKQLEAARELARRSKDSDAVARYTADLGALAVLEGDPERASPLLRRALRHFMRTNNRDWCARCLANLSEAQRHKGDAHGAVRLAEEALRNIPRADHEQRAAILWRLAESLLVTPDSRSLGLRLLKRSTDAYERSGDETLYAWQCALAASALREAGLSKDSISFSDQALEVYRRLRNGQMVFRVRNDRAIALLMMGHLDTARKEFSACLSHARRMGDRAMTVQALTNRGETLTRQDRPSAAVTDFRQAARTAQQSGDASAEAQALGGLGIALTRLQRWSAAADRFRRARDLARRARDRGSEATALGGLASVAFVRGHHAAALRDYQRAARLWEEERNPYHLIEDLAGATESLAALGRVKEMRITAQRLVTISQEIGADRVASEALARSARWLLRDGSMKIAASLYAASIIIGGTQAERRRDAIRGVSEAALLVALHVESDLPRDKHDGFYRMLGRSLNEHSEGLADMLEQTTATARAKAQALGLAPSPISLDGKVPRTPAPPGGQPRRPEDG